MEKRIEEYLEGLSRQELKKALVHLIELNKSNKEAFLKEAGPALEKNLASLRDERIKKQWTALFDLLDNYDESDYGYFDYSTDDNVDEYGNTLTSLHYGVKEDIKELAALVKENSALMDPDLKLEIGEETMHFLDGGICYELSDYGVFDEELLKLLQALCSTKEERFELAKELDQNNLGAVDFIAEAYSESQGVEQSLEFRLEHCTRDAKELLAIINGFIELGQEDRAVSIARDRYANNRNIRGSDSSQQYMLWEFIEKSFNGDDKALAEYVRGNSVSNVVKERLLKHFMDKDYELSKDLFRDLVLFNASNHSFLTWYRDARNYLKEEDFKAFGEDIKAQWKDSRKDSWLELCIEDGEYKTVLDAVLEDAPNAKPMPKQGKYLYRAPLDAGFHFSGCIAKQYPDKIGPYIWKRVDDLANAGERENYAEAVRGLAVLKTIEPQAVFKAKLADLLERYRTKRLLKQLIAENGLL